MSAKRLREAADRLDEGALIWSYPGTKRPVNNEVIALLRSLIRWTPSDWTGKDEGASYCPLCIRYGRHDDDCPVRLAGLLADSILGSPEGVTSP